MTWSVRLPLAILALVLSAIAGAIIAEIVNTIESRHSSARVWQPADVKIVGVEGGHGSGFHIGKGLYITAAHVVRKDQAYRIEYADGNQHDVEILWAAKGHDVALLRIADDTAKVARLDCNPPTIGAPIVAMGNPLEYTGITMHGHVAGDVKPIGTHKSAFVADVSFAHGMSGGALYSGGKVIGMAVAVRMVGVGGMAYSRFGVGIPSSVICDLLGR